MCPRAVNGLRPSLGSRREMTRMSGDQRLPSTRRPEVPANRSRQWRSVRGFGDRYSAGTWRQWHSVLRTWRMPPDTPSAAYARPTWLAARQVQFDGSPGLVRKSDQTRHRCFLSSRNRSGWKSVSKPNCSVQPRGQQSTSTAICTPRHRSGASDLIRPRDFRGRPSRLHRAAARGRGKPEPVKAFSFSQPRERHSRKVTATFENSFTFENRALSFCI
jgi:hypothetical protein